MADETPLIHTTLGNVPVSDLQFDVIWDVSDDAVVCKPTYFKDGIKVREDAYLCILKPLEAGGDISQDV